MMGLHGRVGSITSEGALAQRLFFTGVAVAVAVGRDGYPFVCFWS